jgi:hypothetical protein
MSGTARTVRAMTEDQQPEPDNSLASVVGDPLLGILQADYNARTVEPPGQEVTLLIGGLVVSGRLTPDWLWARDQAHRFQDAWVLAGRSPDTIAPMATAFHSLEQGSMDRRDGQGEGEMTPARFIHLSEGRVLNMRTGPAPWPRNEVNWRFPLAQIDGWCLGAPVPEPEDPDRA